MPTSLIARASLVAAALVALAAPARAFSPGFNYGSDKVRGVNLGGWLVLEPWITPSLFDNTGNTDIVDEWTFCQYQSNSVAKAALQKHWDSWITESDFSQIKAAGLNHVRVPIGFWAFDVSGGEPYIQGQLPYLWKAVNWASKHGLKVIVDLHGVPGSQNGFDNSGRRVTYPQWQSSQSNIDRTNAIIKTLADMFKDNTYVVPTITPMNEPAGFYGDAVLNPLKQYYRDSYGSIRYPYGSGQQSNTLMLISDAFQPQGYWNGFMPSSQYQGVALDTHIYQVFSDAEVQMSEDDHIQTACSKQSDLGASNQNLYTIVGEWSPARTDCAKYLNGLGVGARYDGSRSGSQYVGSCGPMTGDGSKFSGSYKTFLRKYWEAQAMSYEKASGWIQWCWKAENADDWSYQAGLQYGWIPQNPTSYQYPNICG